MGSVTTVALLSRKDGMSPELFSRYWRDVHGTLAARIPGFDAYVQYHLGEASHDELGLPGRVSTRGPAQARLDGIAEVLFRDEADRAGLATSEVAALIQDDERNVFSATLLYNLGHGASRTLFERDAAGDAGCFVLLGRRDGAPVDALPAAIAAHLAPALARHPAVATLRLHGLASGDPGEWITAGVDNRPTPERSFDAILHVAGAREADVVAALRDAFAQSPPLADVLGKAHPYGIRARHAMVLNGRPTHLGLRGLDMLRTIEAAGAGNQLSDAVLQRLYGVAPAAA